MCNLTTADFYILLPWTIVIRSKKIRFLLVTFLFSIILIFTSRVMAEEVEDIENLKTNDEIQISWDVNDTERIDAQIMRYHEGKMSEWNNWIRSVHDTVSAEVKLEDRQISNLNLTGILLKNSTIKNIHFEKVDMSKANMERAELHKSRFYRTNLEEANFSSSGLQDIRFFSSNLTNSDFSGSQILKTQFQDSLMNRIDFRGATMENVRFHSNSMQKSRFYAATMKDVDFFDCDMQGTSFFFTLLENVNFIKSNLQNIIFENQDLRGGAFVQTDLRGTQFINSNLEGVSFHGSIIDASTLFQFCDFDKNTNFKLTGINNARISQRDLTEIQGNIRQELWGRWYEEQNPIVVSFAKMFWFVSDYGRSTVRIFCVFFMVILLFALFYAYINWYSKQMVPIDVFPPDEYTIYLPDTPKWFFKLFCFSLISMFTVSLRGKTIFRNSKYSNLLLTLSVLNLLVGYFLLSSLVARFGIMFQSLSP